MNQVEPLWKFKIQEGLDKNVKQEDIFLKILHLLKIQVKFLKLEDLNIKLCLCVE